MTNQDSDLFADAVSEARRILSGDNECSRFCGGLGAATLNNLAAVVNQSGRSAYGPFQGDGDTGIRMEIPTQLSLNKTPLAPFANAYIALMPSSVTINNNGQFLRAIPFGTTHLARFGGYDPGSLQSRVLHLLHEVGHLISIETYATVVTVKLQKLTIEGSW